MEKIKGLLAKSGCKPELVDAIAESLEQYKGTLKENFEREFSSKMESIKKDYSAKTEAVKKVCVEETEAHKRELARRLQIFCETKAANIEAQLTKMSALSESQAVSKLKNVKAMLEGVQLNGQRDGKTAAEVEKAQRKIQQLSEERDRAIAEANRKTAIAEKALKANRQLVTENLRLGEVRTPVVTETRAARRLEAPRRPARPATSRPTLTESQDRRPAKPRTTPNVITAPNGGFSVMDIAATMDSDLI